MKSITVCKIIVISLLLCCRAYAVDDMYKKHSEKKLNDEQIQNVFQAVLHSSQIKLEALESNVPQNIPLFEYYVGIEVSLDSINYKTFICDQKEEVKLKLLFDFDPKYQELENMPEAVLHLGQFLDDVCK